MRVLIRTSMRSVREEVEDMTPKEASDIWEQIKPFLPGVAAKAGLSKAGMKWGELLRKMQMIQKKAEV